MGPPRGRNIRKDHPIGKILAGAAALAATLLAIPAGTSGAQASADIMLLHGIPGIDVDVAVDGAVVIPGFEPGDMQDLSSFAGQTLVNLEVRPAGTEDVAIGPVASFDVPASGSWTVVAHLDADGINAGDRPEQGLTFGRPPSRTEGGARRVHGGRRSGSLGPRVGIEPSTHT